jgi:hypothetical protein
MFLSMAYTSKQREETNAKHNKAAALFQTGFSGPERALQKV